MKSATPENQTVEYLASPYRQRVEVAYLRIGTQRVLN